MQLQVDDDGQMRKERIRQTEAPLVGLQHFFKEERSRILDDIPDIEGDLRGSRKSGEKQPHGKIDFQSLAKLIGKRWKQLTESDREVYKLKSEEDMKRYKSVKQSKYRKLSECIEQENVS